ncbi:MAG: hypothetical protein K2Y39_20425 [Candidatus Obscuribacterales bacterium]|nr:hypothetical protein [Candidatus Obscuribacterales bacterium]
MIAVQKLKTLIAAALLGTPLIGPASMSFAANSDLISVTKEPPIVQIKTFDHANPGPEVPIKGREAATTHCSFDYVVDIGLQSVSSRRNGDIYSHTFKITRLAVRLNLPITFWLPDTVNRRLREHEDGHRQIYEEIYSNAEKTAERQAQELLSETFIGQGKTLDEAQNDAKTKIGIELNRRYGNEILAYAKMVTQLYDNATRSGTNRTPVFLAIRESFLQAWFMNLTKKR